MILNMISAAAEQKIPLGDAAIYSLIGFTLVVCILFLLVGIFYLSGYLLQKDISLKNIFKKKKSDKNAEEVADVIEEETVAVITAAISEILAQERAALVQEQTEVPFVIKNIKINR